MKVKVNKMICNRQSMDTYINQTTVIRKTNMSSTMNYGKIVAFSDSDVDG